MSSKVECSKWQRFVGFREPPRWSGRRLNGMSSYSDKSAQNPILLFRSSTGLTDTLHLLSIAGPLFLILLGSYVIYEKLITDPFVRTAVLLAILGVVAGIAPMGSRLKHVEISKYSLRVLASHLPSYEIVFADIERISTVPVLGMVKLRISASETLPNDSVWIILEVPDGKTRQKVLEECRGFLQQRLEASGN
ncbi:MAG: hypothetical protein LAO31_04020 [Acidobacteriia bacterium]|nr:hypothetical protein [Terriglobia bacterium]